jgi:hypothetical protein
VIIIYSLLIIDGIPQATMPLNLDDVIAKSRATNAETDMSMNNKSTAGKNSEGHNASYRSQGSSGSNHRKVTLVADMTDEERTAAAIAKLKSAMAGGKKEGGPNAKFKGLVKASILHKQLDEGSFAPKSVDAQLTSDDTDLVPPNVVLDLWYTASDGVTDGKIGK